MVIKSVNLVEGLMCLDECLGMKGIELEEEVEAEKKKVGDE